MGRIDDDLCLPNFGRLGLGSAKSIIPGGGLSRRIRLRVPVRLR